MVDWFLENLEWIFSGIGVAALALLWRVFGRRDTAAASTAGPTVTVRDAKAGSSVDAHNYDGGDVTVDGTEAKTGHIRATTSREDPRPKGEGSQQVTPSSAITDASAGRDIISAAGEVHIHQYPGPSVAERPATARTREILTVYSFGEIRAFEAIDVPDITDSINTCIREALWLAIVRDWQDKEAPPEAPPRDFKPEYYPFSSIKRIDEIKRLRLDENAPVASIPPPYILVVVIEHDGCRTPPESLMEHAELEPRLLDARLSCPPSNLSGIVFDEALGALPRNHSFWLDDMLFWFPILEEYSAPPATKIVIGTGWGGDIRHDSESHQLSIPIGVACAIHNQYVEQMGFEASASMASNFAAKVVYDLYVLYQNWGIDKEPWLLKIILESAIQFKFKDFVEFVSSELPREGMFAGEFLDDLLQYTKSSQTISDGKRSRLRSAISDESGV